MSEERVLAVTSKELKHLIKLDWVARVNGDYVMQKGQYEGWKLEEVKPESK